MGAYKLPRYLPKALVIGGLLLLLLWGVATTVSLYLTLRSLEETLSEVTIMTERDLSGIDVDHVESLILAIRDDSATLNRIGRPFAKVGSKMGWVPKVGPLLAAAPELLKSVDSGSAAAYYSIRGLKPLLEYLQNNVGEERASIPAILKLIQDSIPDLEIASQYLVVLENATVSIDKTGLPVTLRTILDRLDQELPDLRSGLLVAQMLPEALGMDGRRSYLILAQNSDELRATGGFISGAGLVVLEGGRFISIEFENANGIDDWRNKPYGDPPRPFREFMGMDIFLFRDANFWPDFPTSAEMAMDLYIYGKGVGVDGAIAIDQQFVQSLLGAIGPLYVLGLDRTINENNVLPELQNEWGPTNDQIDWITQRKAFMGPLANSFRFKMESDLPNLDFLAIAKALSETVREGHFQFYSRDPKHATLLAKAGWDGRQNTKSAQDFVQIIDTNMGFNKVNAVVDREVSYRIVLSEVGHGIAELTVDYIHQGISPDKACVHGTQYNSETKYSDLFNDCFWNYLRVYVPSGTSLLQASTHPIIARQLLSGQSWNGVARETSDDLTGLTVLENFFLLESNNRVAIKYVYRLPNSIILDDDGLSHYSLHLQKQAGTEPHKLDITVILPEGAEWKTSTLDPVSVKGESLSMSTMLAQDLSITIVYDNNN